MSRWAGLIEPLGLISMAASASANCLGAGKFDLLPLADCGHGAGGLVHDLVRRVDNTLLELLPAGMVDPEGAEIVRLDDEPVKANQAGNSGHGLIADGAVVRIDDDEFRDLVARCVDQVVMAETQEMLGEIPLSLNPAATPLGSNGHEPPVAEQVHDFDRWYEAVTVTHAVPRGGGEDGRGGAVKLALGLVAQVVPLPFRRGQRAVRMVLWALGWLVWLFGGQVSFMHAFS